MSTNPTTSTELSYKPPKRSLPKRGKKSLSSNSVTSGTLSRPRAASTIAASNLSSQLGGSSRTRVSRGVNARNRRGNGNDSGPTNNKWAKVFRHPFAPPGEAYFGSSPRASFLVPMWVRVEELTSEELEKYEKEEKRKEQQRQLWRREMQKKREEDDKKREMEQKEEEERAKQQEDEHGRLKQREEELEKTTQQKEEEEETKKIQEEKQNEYRYENQESDKKEHQERQETSEEQTQQIGVMTQALSEGNIKRASVPQEPLSPPLQEPSNDLPTDLIHSDKPNDQVLHSSPLNLHPYSPEDGLKLASDRFPSPTGESSSLKSHNYEESQPQELAYPYSQKESSLPDYSLSQIHSEMVQPETSNYSQLHSTKNGATDKDLEHLRPPPKKLRWRMKMEHETPCQDRPKDAPESSPNLMNSIEGMHRSDSGSTNELRNNFSVDNTTISNRNYGMGMRANSSLTSPENSINTNNHTDNNA